MIRDYAILGDLEAWFDMLKALGAAVGKTRGELAALTDTGYNTFCRAMRDHLLPMGILEQDGFTREGRRGRATTTFKVTAKGRALLAAIEQVEYRFGPLSEAPRHRVPKVFVLENR
ncbi:MAG: hypothetical protein V3W28_04300 [Thermoplasmata archaeon]